MTGVFLIIESVSKPQDRGKEEGFLQQKPRGRCPKTKAREEIDPACHAIE